MLKHALIDSGGFISNMRTNDTMRIITFSSDGISTGTWVDGSQKALLKTKALNAGSYNGDDYRTSGGTPGPKALQQANQVLQNSPPSPIPGAKPYRHAVIYLTDGVANIFLDGTTNYAKDICSEFNGDNRALNTPRCQFDPPPDYLPNASHGMRPISAMIDQASKMKTKFPDMQLFVIALAQVNPLGLDQVASNPKMLYLARQAGLVDTVLSQIRQKVVGTCTESGGAAWINLIDAAHTATMPAPYTLPSGVFGYVYLFDKNYTPVSVPWTGQGADPRGPKVNAIPITQDSESGTLGYSIPTDKGLAAGVYYQQAYVNYKAAAPQGDGVSRQYDTIMDGLAPVPFAQFTLTPSEVLGASVVLKPVRLDLDPATALCP